MDECYPSTIPPLPSMTKDTKNVTVLTPIKQKHQALRQHVTRWRGIYYVEYKDLVSQTSHTLFCGLGHD